ncbi:MAG: fumarylacetoacetate hydrolase family protein [Prolixibacteraceae bacterium]|nr:fumarylacetoacetate hydrolase family protein [Prolixibacteraceae bacterium]
MKIICIGRNYVEHIEELKNERPDEPVFFMKPDTSILRKNRPFYIPSFSNDLQHEVELIIKIDKVGKNISKKFAHRYYSSIGIGIDFTARDIQNELISKGLPWEKCKAFDNSAAFGEEFISLDQLDKNNIEFHLDINGDRRQTGNSSKMIFSFDDIISHVSKYITLKTGDLIYTGTPSGVSPVKINDRLQAYIGDKKLMDFLIK